MLAQYDLSSRIRPLDYPLHLTSQALAQPDVNPPPPLTGHGPALTAHRKAALYQKCTNGIKFDSTTRYVNCIRQEGRRGSPKRSKSDRRVGSRNRRRSRPFPFRAQSSGWPPN